MKKYLKLFPVALAAFAMASCSDDLWDSQSAEKILSDPNNMLVTVEELGEQGPVTRSAFGETMVTSGANEGKLYRQFIWTSGDQFKVYDQTNWRIEYWKLNGTANTALAKDNTATEGTVFSLDTDATDENNRIESKNRAYAIYPSVVKTTPISDPDKQAKFGEFNENRTQMTVTLPAEIVVNGDVITENSGASYAATGDAGYAYTCQAPMWGYSKGSTDGNKITFQYLTSFVRVSLKGLGVGTKFLKVTAPTGKYIAGKFTIDDFDYATYGTGKVPALAAPTVAADGSQTITVKVTTTKAASENVIFIPVPAQDYGNALTVKMGDAADACDNDVDEVVAGGEAAVTNYKRGKFTKFGSETAEEVEVTGLADLNKVISDYANFGRAVTITVKPVAEPGGAAQDVKVRAGSDYAPLATKLSLPTLNNDITLNFSGAGIKLEEATALNIEDASTAGTGKLTINIPENTDGTDADELADYTLPAVVVKSAQAIEFGYIADDSEATKIPVFGSLTVDKAGAKVTANGAYGANAITVNSAAEFAIGTNFNGTGNVSNNGATTLTLGAAANVIADVATTLNIKFNQTTIKTSATTINVEANVTNLYLMNTTAKQTVNLKAGTIATLGGATTAGDAYTFADGQNFEVKSEGVSAITTVKGDTDEATVTKAFNSKWNITDDDATALAALEAPTANIYTAAQLAKVANEGTADYVLKTNITEFTSAWTSPDVKCTTFKATGVTITGLNAPLFGVVKGGALSDVTISGASIAANDDLNSSAGIFAKQAVGTVSFKNVHVTGTNTITGKYYVGGIVGIVGDGTNVTAVTIGDAANETAANKVTLAGVSFSTTATDLGTSGFELKAGTFGKLVGTVKDAAAKKTELTIVDGDCSVTGGTFNKTTLLFSNNRRYNNQYVNNGWFKGESDLIGYIDAVNNETSITLGGKKYINAGTQVQQGETTTYDVYYIGAKGGNAALPATTEAGKTLVCHYLNSYYTSADVLIVGE